jgi:hypothetical protein
MELLKEVGAIAGFASFLGLAVLSLLYFAQARDVRRLRENAEFLVEGPEGEDERTAVAADAPVPTAATVSTRAPEKAAREAAKSAPTEAEAFRRAELARQAAERRQRFERRRTSDGHPEEGLMSRLPQGSSLVVIIIGGLLLLGGLAFAGQQLISSEDGTTPKGGKANSACPPGETEVAVFNGTATSGLAGQSTKLLRERQFKVSATTNSESQYETSVVMFDQGGQECAAAVSEVVGIPAQQPINAEIQGLAGGAQVAVVLGEDKATGG